MTFKHHGGRREPELECAGAAGGGLLAGRAGCWTPDVDCALASAGPWEAVSSGPGSWLGFVGGPSCRKVDLGPREVLEFLRELARFLGEGRRVLGHGDGKNLGCPGVTGPAAPWTP